MTTESKPQVDGGPAFPYRFGNDSQCIQWEGMNLRDYFAAAALTGILPHLEKYKLNGKPINSLDVNIDIAFACYGIADAMLKARKEGK